MIQVLKLLLCQSSPPLGCWIGTIIFLGNFSTEREGQAVYRIWHIYESRPCQLHQPHDLLQRGKIFNHLAIVGESIFQKILKKKTRLVSKGKARYQTFHQPSHLTDIRRSPFREEFAQVGGVKILHPSPKYNRLVWDVVEQRKNLIPKKNFQLFQVFDDSVQT